MIEALMVPLMAGLNRLAGDGRWKRALHVPGRPIWWAALGSFLAMWPVTGATFAWWAAFSFAAWRTLGWYNAIDAGTNTETPSRDFWVMTARGIPLFPIFVHALGWSWGAIATLVVSLAIAGTYHAAWHFKWPFKLPADRIPFAEWLSGGVIGLALWGAYALR